MSLIPVLALSALAGCSLCQKPQEALAAVPAAVVEPAPVAAVLAAAAPVLGKGKPAAALDKSTKAEKAAALAPAPAVDTALGKVVVALGSPSEQGFWLKSSLITAPTKGRVVTASGASVNVDLQPGKGAALLSLAAFRALGLGLTDLPEVTIYKQ